MGIALHARPVGWLVRALVLHIAADLYLNLGRLGSGLWRRHLTPLAFVNQLSLVLQGFSNFFNDLFTIAKVHKGHSYYAYVLRCFRGHRTLD